MQGVVFAGVQAVHARHAAAVIDAMVLVVDAGGLAAARTEAAIPALLRVEHRTEQRETGEESQDRSHGTDRIAIGASVPPCQLESAAQLLLLADGRPPYGKPQACRSLRASPQIPSVCAFPHG